jgi:hypothetical protein
MKKTRYIRDNNSLTFWVFAFSKKRNKNTSITTQQKHYEFRSHSTISRYTFYCCGRPACNCLTFYSWRKSLICATPIFSSFRKKRCQKDQNAKKLTYPFGQKLHETLVSCRMTSYTNWNYIYQGCSTTLMQVFF